MTQCQLKKLLLIVAKCIVNTEKEIKRAEELKVINSSKVYCKYKNHGIAFFPH